MVYQDLAGEPCYSFVTNKLKKIAEAFHGDRKSGRLDEEKLRSYGTRLNAFLRLLSSRNLIQGNRLDSIRSNLTQVFQLHEA